MNVLQKIVIPKTHVTMEYINRELEEFGREEFFRLKKILEIKRKMYGGKNEKKKQSATMSTTCEPAVDWGVIERCIVCDALLLPEPEHTEEDERLEEFKTHLSEIVNITKDMDEQGIITASVEDFIKTAEQLKEKLEEKSQSTQSTEQKPEICDKELKHLCAECKKNYLADKAAKAAEDAESPEADVEELEPEEIEPVKPEPEIPPQVLKPTIKPTQPVALEQVDLELGTFETEIKEITKIVRVKREDGTISEEKKVIRVKKEVRAPVRVNAVPPPNAVNQERLGRITYQPSKASGGSSKSSPYSGSRTIGVVTTKSLDYSPFYSKHDVIKRRAKSEILLSSSPMSNPVARYCMSSVSLCSIDFGEYSSSVMDSCINYDDYEL